MFMTVLECVHVHVCICGTCMCFYNVLVCLHVYVHKCVYMCFHNVSVCMCVWGSLSRSEEVMDSLELKLQVRHPV